jgi:hypothetical protein
VAIVRPRARGVAVGARAGVGREQGAQHGRHGRLLHLLPPLAARRAAVQRQLTSELKLIGSMRRRARAVRATPKREWASVLTPDPHATMRLGLRFLAWWGPWRGVARHDPARMMASLMATRQ